jgi:hypothetical protein
MSDIRTILVCLPAGRRPHELADLAADQLARHDLPACGTVAHFRPGTRRGSKLLDRSRDSAAGGPVGLLDLEGMRRRAYVAAAQRWLLWRAVVAGTRSAQPWWVYADRHHADPRRYPLHAAREQYLTQSRLLAMATYNALPCRADHLPPAQIEAFQAGQRTYAWLAWLTAVPADGLTLDQSAPMGLLTKPRGRLTAQLSYLREANACLDRLHPKANLVAMVTT